MKVRPVYIHEDEQKYRVKNYTVVVRPNGKNACTCTHGTYHLGKEDEEWSFCKHLEVVMDYRKGKKGFKRMAGQ